MFCVHFLRSFATKTGIVFFSPQFRTFFFTNTKKKRVGNIWLNSDSDKKPVELAKFKRGKGKNCNVITFSSKYGLISINSELSNDYISLLPLKNGMYFTIFYKYKYINNVVFLLFFFICILLEFLNCHTNKAKQTNNEQKPTKKMANMDILLTNG